MAYPLQAAPHAKKLVVLDRMVASVNGEAITESDLNKQTQLLLVRLQQTDTALPPMNVLHKQLLERMILEKLQLQLATQEGVIIDDSTLDNAIEEIASRDNLSLHQMQKFLEEQGIPFAQFCETIKTEITLSKLQQKEVGQNIIISKAEIEHFLTSPAGLGESDTEFRLGHILFPVPEEATKVELDKIEAEAKTIVKQLKTGANFSEVAIAKSSGQQALEGGDLGWRKLGFIPTVFVKVVPTLKVNEIYGPIQDSSGFHIIKLLDKRNTITASLKPKQEVHLRQILIKTSAKRSEPEVEERLAALRQQIVNGASFAQLAQKHSEEMNSATKGGDIGWVSEASVVSEFNQQMAKLKAGEISQPFKTSLGWHLIQIIEKRTRTTPNEALRNKAMEVLYQQKFDEQLISWLRRLRANAEVEIYLNGL